MKAIKTRLDNLQKQLNSTQCDFAIAFVENGIYTHQEKNIYCRGMGAILQIK